MTPDTLAEIQLVATDYFPGYEKPGFKGVYKRRLERPSPDDSDTFAYWDGDKWYRDCATIEEALLEAHTSHYNIGVWEDFEWSGIVPPEGFTVMTDDDGVIQPWKSEPLKIKGLAVEIKEVVSPENFFAEPVIESVAPIEAAYETAAFVNDFFGS